MPDNSLPPGFTLDQAPIAAPSSDPTALPDGFQLDDDKYSTPTEIGKTALEGLASGATLGGSKILEESLFHNAAARKAREEVNPVTAGVSNLVGFGGMAALTGGLGAAGEALGGGALATIGGAGLEGAVVGGVNQATDDWSQNKPLDAEKIAMSAGLGGILGVGGAGLIEGAKAAPSAVEAMSNLIKGDATIAPSATPSSWLEKVQNAYNLSGKDPNEFIGKLTDTLGDLKEQADNANSSMYEEAGQFHLQNALENMPVEQAQTIGKNTLDQIDSLVNESAPSTHEQLQSQLSEAENNPKLQDLQDQLSDVQQEKSAVEQEQEFNARNREPGDPERLKTNERWGKLSDAEDDLKLKLAKLQQNASGKVSLLGETLANTSDAIDFSEGRQSKLSGAGGEVLNQKLGTLQEALNGAETPLDVHNALTDFATNLDKGIKFDKLPTAAQQADQDLLQNVRSLIRGNLKDPETWGKAAPVYEEISDNYSNYKTALKNFQKDWTKPRIGSTGKTTRVIDPSKVKTYFNNPGDPGQTLKGQSLNEFLSAAMKNAEYGQNYSEWQGKFGDVVSKLRQAGLDIDKNASIADVVKQLKTGGSNGELGLGTYAVLEALPTPIRAPLIVAMKAHELGSNPATLGKSLYHGMNAAKALAEHAENASNKIDKAARTIFTGASSQVYKGN